MLGLEALDHPGTHANDPDGILHQLSLYHHWTGEPCELNVDAISLKLQPLSRARFRRGSQLSGWEFDFVLTDLS